MAEETQCGCILKDTPQTVLLEQMIDQYGSRVLKLAYYYVRNYSDAEDIMQEVFLRVYQNMHSFRGESACFTWIYRITVNLCKDYLLRQGRRQTVPLVCDTCGESLPEQERMFEAAEGGEVFSAVMELPLKYRTVIALYYFDEMPVKEIANALKVSECNVRARLSRGRKLLKEALSAKGMSI
ncbi:sigma-70 family RNA polymerase sigma factor [Marasmitruncus massiliensis]|uniref:sigma-70 family RNA polymerase sigma factor n=1 Tax=Marasmitruncus massiliensis TaxID=1944642 RepID=UPI0015E141B3|nr:sigma-70 family RNA polymerase sigma factor [Marasmitruncus massiliensis]